MLQQIYSALLSIAQAINGQTQAIKIAFPSGTGTAGSAVGGAATLPANPVGYITTTIPGTTTVVKVPYYS